MKQATSTPVGEAVELLSHLISTPSFSRQEEAASHLIADTLQRYGLPFRRSGNNVWSLTPHYRPELPTVMLNSHIDTVKPVSGWQRDPFAATTEGDRLYGLGSNDAGASLVSLLHTYRQLVHTPQPYNLLFAASCEEEVSGSGGMEQLLRELPPIHFAVVGEPTGLQPAIAEKGLMVLDVTTLGRAGHAARNEGDNALYKAVDDIAWLRSHRFERISPLLGPVKVSVTVIQAGTQHNVVPDRCTFVVDVRSNELYTNRALYDEIRSHLQGQVEARSFRLNSSRLDPAHPFVRRAVQHGLTPFGSPTLSDQALMPFPSVKIGPGESSRSHTADEYICLSEIESAIHTYGLLLNELEIQ